MNNHLYKLDLCRRKHQRKDAACPYRHLLSSAEDNGRGKSTRTKSELLLDLGG
jgi:hypothetical protein